jgi:hypothetical protein
MDRTGAGTYTTRAYLTANFFKGLNDPVDVGTAGQLLTSEATSGFSWTTVGAGNGQVAAGDHEHSGSEITGTIDGGTF